MSPDRTIKTTSAGRRAAAARDGRLERGQEPTRPLMMSSDAPAGAAAIGPEPAPWVQVPISRFEIDVHHHSEDRDGGYFCRVFALHRTAEAVARLEANARLIAAAPEMLAALELWVRQLDSIGRDGIFPQAATMARAAIAKARGRS